MASAVRTCYNSRQEGVFMGNLDVPEVLIILGILGGIAWAIYNRTHQNAVKRARPDGRL
jgi:hypothetical protein